MTQKKYSVGLYVGVAAAGGVGYYMYQAGGNAKKAEKKLESDLSHASTQMKSELPGRSQQGQNEVEGWAAAGGKVDSAVDTTRAELAKADAKVDQYRKDARKKIDEADRKVEDSATKAKSGVSNWFGFGGK